MKKSIVGEERSLIFLSGDGSHTLAIGKPLVDVVKDFLKGFWKLPI